MNVNHNESYTYWMSGYDKYYNAMQNRADYDEKITTNLDPLTALENIKQWLFDHNESGSDYGGTACFLTNMNGIIYSEIGYLPEYEEYYRRTKVVGYLNPFDENHYLTIVGYDDNVPCFDYDGSGTYVNDDYDGNGYIDLDEYEKGAFIVVNSWSEGYYNNYNDKGFIYLPYKFLNYNSLLIEDMLHLLYVKDTYNPEIVLKVKMEHPNRSRIKLGCDFNQKANDPLLEDWYPNYVFRAFSFNGGNNPMRGDGNNVPIELALDYSYFNKDNDVGMVLFEVHQSGGNPQGEVLEFSMIDYRWGEEFQVDCPIENGTLNIGNNWFGINYDLIVPGDDQIIDAVKIINSDMVSRFSPIVTGNGSLVISGSENDEDRVNIDMYNSTIFIDKGCQLSLGDRVKFTAKQGENYIVINGDISYKEGYKIAEYLDFEAEDGSSLEIHFNGDQIIELSNAGFKNITIKSKLPDIRFTNCVFNNSVLNQQQNNLSVDACSFNFSSIVAKNPSSQPILINNNVTITNSTFSSPNENSNSILEIYGYENFFVDNNEFNCILYNEPELYNNAIVINFSGSSEGDNIISNNIIKNAINSNIQGMSGIQLYSSNAIITMNDIHDNSIGINSLNNSQVEIVGYKLATVEEETQQINNNIDYQLFASTNAFPELFIWNSVYGGFFDGECYIKHDIDIPIMVLNENVAWNYWGDNFNKDINLCPSNHYDYTPVWQLSSSAPEFSDAQLLYNEAQSYIIDSSYNLAKLTFKQIVNTYPMHSQAKQSMKELLYLEPLCNNNFEVLKNWYLSDSTIVEYTELEELGKELVVKCDEKLENFQSAIDWYESIIQDPPTLEDSVFAIIDLEHLYWTMGIDTTLRSASYVGKLSQFVPESFQKLRNERDYLLSLLHKNNSSSSNITNNEELNNQISSSNNCQIINLPNPFNSITTFRFNTQLRGDFYIKIYDQNGNNVKTINFMNLFVGEHNFRINMDDLRSGIYYYSLNSVSGIISSNKMIITN